jgi:hypothetical protein
VLTDSFSFTTFERPGGSNKALATTIDFAWSIFWWWAVVNVVMKLQVPSVRCYVIKDPAAWR